MKATFRPCKPMGRISAPPSKSMAHRYLISAALSGQKCLLSGVDYSEDILASIDCLKALGANITKEDHRLTMEPSSWMQTENPTLNCRESGSTLRFFIPLALCLGKKVVFQGSQRLFERPLSVYESLCNEKGFSFEKGSNTLTVCGKLKSGEYTVKGNLSSQFITGLIFALVYLNGNSAIEILPPVESRPYIDMTVSALKSFGAKVDFVSEVRIEIKPSVLRSFSGKIEGDYSNAAFLSAFNYLGSEVKIENLNNDSLQGDKVYSQYFEALSMGAPTLDISHCPDLGPILFALAAMKNGGCFVGTDRLKDKESDRAAAMHQELSKLGGGLIFGDNTVTVPKQKLQYKGEMLCGHNDHRIVMALSVILSQIGGTIDGVEAVRKSYPSFFDDLKSLNAEIELI